MLIFYLFKSEMHLKCKKSFTYFSIVKLFISLSSYIKLGTYVIISVM